VLAQAASRPSLTLFRLLASLAIRQKVKGLLICLTGHRRVLGKLRQLAEYTAISPYDGVTADRYGTVVKSTVKPMSHPPRSKGNGDPDFARLGRPRGRLSSIFFHLIRFVQSLPRLVPKKSFAGTSLSFRSNLV